MKTNSCTDEEGENILDHNKSTAENKILEDVKSSEEKRTNGLSINVENLKSTFTGMSKDELMKYANDSFWIKTRLVFFISFWVIWCLMLSGAVFIIISTPKCEMSTRIWYERGPIYEINLNHLHNSKTFSYDKTVFDFLRTKITYLKDLGVETILLRSVFQTTDLDDEIIDYKHISPVLGTLHNFQELIKHAVEKGVRILLSFTPNHSSDKNDMFARSILKEDDYSDYYVWVNSDPKDPSKPPNNWVSILGGSAWTYNEERKQYYLHQFAKTQPDFNFRNPAVIEYFNDVLNFWLKQGVSGIHLDYVEYLLEDDQFRNEALSFKPGFTHDQYGFYTHKRTSELPETTFIIKKWFDLISNNSGILSVSGGIGDNSNVTHLVMQPIRLAVNFTAAALNTTIQSWVRYQKWPVWKWQCESKLEEECIPETLKDGLMIISLLLPGVPVNYLGQEFGYPYDYIPSNFRNDSKSPNDLFQRTQETIVGVNQTNNPVSHYSVYKSLLQLRKDQIVMFGKFRSKVLNETVFSFIREKSDAGGYVIAWNLGNDSVEINLQDLDSSIPHKMTVSVKSNHEFDSSYQVGNTVFSTMCKIPAKAAIVFNFNAK